MDKTVNQLILFNFIGKRRNRNLKKRKLINTKSLTAS